MCRHEIVTATAAKRRGSVCIVSQIGHNHAASVVDPIRPSDVEIIVNPTRRTVLHAGAAALVSPVLAPLAGSVVRSAHAQEGAGEAGWRHGLSLFGDLKYPAGFKHFDYVNPKAPKGGLIRRTGTGTFDNFNYVVAGVKGTLALGATEIYDTLSTAALDEVSAEYGLLAEAIQYPDDFAWVVYRLRPEAKWHDGVPITPADVIFSLESVKQYMPQLAAYYRHVVKAEQIGERGIRFTFDAPGNRELPQIVGQLVVLPKHWWEGTDASGRKRDISATTLEPPLGSGPYRIKDFTAGRSVTLERVKDYWGANINVNVGRDNFDEIRYEYFRDSTVAIEAFKADAIDWRTESSAKEWTTAYDFPAFRDKRVLKQEFRIRTRGVMQAFVPNTRRDKFKDVRVRRALNYVFDFQEMNKQLFFGQYTRIASYFEGTELASSGLPQGQELSILETVRDKVPAEVFTTEYSNPVAGNPEAIRSNLREALRLLRDAGYEVRNQKLTNAKSGEQVSIELLSLAADPAYERVALFYKPSLERLGFTVNVRSVDPVQYVNRLRNFDFDMLVIASWPESLSPGNEQRDFWSSQAADTPGSRNYIGIKNPAVDAMIERVIYAKNRDELVAATRALDRVLLWNHYVIPQWTYPFERTVRWDRFSYPEKMPEYGASAFPEIWWWDEDKAAKLRSRS